MKLGEWLDIEFLRALVRHGSGSVFALAIFAIIGFAAELLVRDDTLRAILRKTDDVVLIGIVVWLALQLAHQLWRHRSQ